MTNSEAERFEGLVSPSSIRRGSTFAARAPALLPPLGTMTSGGLFALGSVAGRLLPGSDGRWPARGQVCSEFHASEGTSSAGGRPPLPVPPDRARQLSGLRVLVVEDDVDARELVTAILEDAGAVVAAAESAAEGFAAVTSFRPDLLVSDISMPDEDGYSLIRRVRALAVTEGGEIPSIALTAHTRIEDRTKALRAGFTLHMGKPVRPVDLVAAVKKLATAASN